MASNISLTFLFVRYYLFRNVKRKKMKRIFTLLFVSVLFTGFSQELNLAFVGVGGSFSDPTDNARLIAIDLSSKEVFGIDTIIANSIQDVEVDMLDDFESKIFFAAQDSVAVYELNPQIGQNTTKLDQIYFPRVGKLDATQNELFVGRSFGEGPYLFAFDKLNLEDTLYVSSNINDKYEDLLVLNDSTVAISYNSKGTVDVCGGFGCFADSIGFVDVINTNTWKSQTIKLGEERAGAITMIKALGDSGFLLCSSKNNTITYFNNDFVSVYDTTSSVFSEFLLDEINPSNSSTLMKTTEGNVSRYTFRFTNKSVIMNETIITSTSGKNVANSVNDDFIFGLNTDFASFGEVVVHEAGVENDTIQVGISVEDVEIGSFLLVGLDDVYEDKVSYETYFSDALPAIEFNDFKVYDLQGLCLGGYASLYEVDFASISTGIYFLRNRERKTIRVMKR